MGYKLEILMTIADEMDDGNYTRLGRKVERCRSNHLSARSMRISESQNCTEAGLDLFYSILLYSFSTFTDRRLLNSASSRVPQLSAGSNMSEQCQYVVGQWAGVYQNTSLMNRMTYLYLGTANCAHFLLLERQDWNRGCRCRI
jgi:hypothetical protein